MKFPSVYITTGTGKSLQVAGLKKVRNADGALEAGQKQTKRQWVLSSLGTSQMSKWGSQVETHCRKPHHGPSFYLTVWILFLATGIKISVPVLHFSQNRNEEEGKALFLSSSAGPRERPHSQTVIPSLKCLTIQALLNVIKKHKKILSAHSFPIGERTS